MESKILHGDNLDLMRQLADNSVDAVVTDPPYGISFMGKAWDGKDIEQRHQKREGHKMSEKRKESGRTTNGFGQGSMSAGAYDLSPTGLICFQHFTQEWATECLRILKPGGYLISFSSCRTYHRMVCGIEDAGFEIRDQLAWVFGSGFPKSHNLDGDWDGWGTALKPAYEPIVLARKPFRGTVADNVLQHGTAALHIDACRIAYESANDLESATWGTGTKISGGNYVGGTVRLGQNIEGNPQGRWPANLLHDGSDDVLDCFPDSDGQNGYVGPEYKKEPTGIYNEYGPPPQHLPRKDSGSAARFFYCAKSASYERHAGLEHLEAQKVNDGRKVDADNAYQRGATDRLNIHPTVKPIALMMWLCRLVTPPGGTILDPFMGSGTTGIAAKLEGFNFIGMEREAEYMHIAEGRIAWWDKKRWADYQAGLHTKKKQEAISTPDQLNLFT
jgi:site-specific DNA-methyltransferase (adenine-specific)